MTRTTVTTQVALLIAFAALAVMTPTLAQVPETLSYQGVLTDNDGTPVDDDDYDLTFRLYDASSGGDVLWTEAKVVAVVDGAFSTTLGSTAELDLPFDHAYWLGIQVGDDSELTPRIPLTASPYALNVADGKVVKSMNSLTDDVTLAAGANVNISPAGNTLTISATGTGADSDWVVDGNSMYSAVPGNVGIGTSAPLTKLHLQVTDLGVDPLATHYDRLLVEADEAILGLYSAESGNAGSALTFATMEADALVDKWALIRETTAGGSGLRFTYGTDDDQWQNSTFMYLDDTGAVGIGTRTPDARLDVNGQIKISGGSPGAGKVLASDATGLASWEAMTTEYLFSPHLLRVSGTAPASITPTSSYTRVESDSPAGGSVLVGLPIQIPKKIAGVAQKLYRVTIYYQVEGDAYIDDTRVYRSENNGATGEIIHSTMNRTSTTYTSYTVTDITPSSVFGFLTLYLDLEFNDDTDWIRIGTVVVETVN